MNPARLTPGQHALLESALLQQQQQLERSLQTQLGEGGDRVAHAREQLLQDADDAIEHADERDLDLARSDSLMEQLRQVNAALLRLRSPDYGRCPDCDADIPFDRLQRHPEVLRCVACQSALEKRQGGAQPASL